MYSSPARGDVHTLQPYRTSALEFSQSSASVRIERCRVWLRYKPSHASQPRIAADSCAREFDHIGLLAHPDSQRHTPRLCSTSHQSASKLCRVRTSSHKRITNKTLHKNVSIHTEIKRVSECPCVQFYGHETIQLPSHGNKYRRRTTKTTTAHINHVR